MKATVIRGELFKRGSQDVYPPALSPILEKVLHYGILGLKLNVKFNLPLKT